jgi:hypothetical protein
LSFLRLKVLFLKQISLEVDITYMISSEISIFDVKLVLKSRLKLQRFYEFALKSFVKMAPEAENITFLIDREQYNEIFVVCDEELN